MRKLIVLLVGGLALGACATSRPPKVAPTELSEIRAVAVLPQVATGLPALTPERFADICAMPYSQGERAISGYEPASYWALTYAPGGRWPGCEFHGYMHVTDHQAAFACLLDGAEPSYCQVYDSQCITGEARICEALRKCGGPPTDLYGCLTRALCTAKGSRVYDMICAGTAQRAGRYAGINYDCSAWDIPAGCNAPAPPPPPVQCGDGFCSATESAATCPGDCPQPPPANPCPAGQSCRAECPAPALCTPPAVYDALRKAIDWTPSWRSARRRQLEQAAAAYRPCLDSTGRLEMHLRDADGRILEAPR